LNNTKNQNFTAFTKLVGRRQSPLLNQLASQRGFPLNYLHVQTRTVMKLEDKNEFKNYVKLHFDNLASGEVAIQ